MLDNLIIQLQVLAKASPKQEICGVIGSDNLIYPIRNVASIRSYCYIFDKREYFNMIKEHKEKGVTIAYFYHSHPSGDVSPSKADLALSSKTGIPQIIVSGNAYMVVPNA